jgi:hypothetical protein
LQPPSLSIADAKVHTFSFPATLFAKYFLKIFYPMIINGLEGDFSCGKAKISLKIPFLRPDFLPPLRNFYAIPMRKGEKVINF